MTRKLHIGGKERRPDWEVLNAIADECVDHVGNANDLSRFEAGTFAELYASHVLEHMDYQGELQAALKEWHRVLAPGGRLYVSVPDMDVLARFFLSKDKLPWQERFYMMQLMFGGHEDKYDFHAVGLNREFLSWFMSEAGFVNIRKVDSFGLFRDTSCMEYMGTPISVNMIAEKPAV
jgi:predicted SAM-dependent methyltransferase